LNPLQLHEGAIKMPGQQTSLKKLITSPELAFLMEAHDGISARIAAEAGFKAIWASSLAISAALGVRDNNEASWTQVLEIAEFMNDAAGVPILLDGDTGYGNFNNVRRLIQKLGKRGIAGVCIEDKIFPKTNSFIRGEKQPLADIDEFCGKIKAAKDSQQHADFVVVARVEAFIAGWGLHEALKRAEAYRNAGADAILVHSKKSSPIEIEAFMREWAGRHPIVIVPTRFYTTPADKFREMGISAVIWANHLLRAAVAAMQSVAGRVFRDESVIGVEDRISPIAEIFRLQGDDELREAEKKYLPAADKNINSLILAASRGEELGELTADIPKTLLKVGGRSILASQIDDMNREGIKNITVVRGYAREKISLPGISTIDNEEHASTRELYSLFLARGAFGENTLVTYGDLIFRRHILSDLLNDDGDIVIMADAEYEENEIYHEFVATEEPYSKKLFQRTVGLKDIGPDIEKERRNGEFIGIFRVNARGAMTVISALETLCGRENFKEMRMKDLFMEIIKRSPVRVMFTKGSWVDINTMIDLQRAGDIS